MCDDMNPINTPVTEIWNVYVVFGVMGLMLPLDLTDDLLFFYHQKYQELQNLLHMCIYSSFLGKATKEDRMRPNASLVWQCTQLGAATGHLPSRKASSCHSPNTAWYHRVYLQAKHDEDCWTNCIAWTNWQSMGSMPGGAPHALAFSFHSLRHLFVVIVGHSRVGNTDLGLNWHSHS